MANPKLGKSSAFRKTVRERIMDVLAPEPASATVVAKKAGLGYYTVRDEMQAMSNEGIIRFKGFKGNGHVYEVSPIDRVPSNESIPYAQGPKGKPVKLTEALAFVGKEHSLPVGKAAISAPKLLTRLFMVALKYTESQGTYNVDGVLDNLKKELDNNIVQMEVFLNILKAMQECPNFWDTRYLKTIPNDVDFDRDVVVGAYKYYYPEG